MKVFLLCLLLSGIAGQASAQGVTLPPASDRFAWSPEHRRAADILSNVPLAFNVTASVLDAIRSDDKREAFLELGCSGLATQGTVILLKHFVHQQRPNLRDLKGFPSGHTATAAAFQGWNYSIGIPLTITTGGLRVGSGQHDVPEAIAGGLIGSGWAALCGKIIK